jgi:bacteriophage exclusion system BrxB-like protein
MGRIETLSTRYQRHIEVPWQKTLAGAQRVLMVVYDKELERSFRARKALFEQATIAAGYRWKEVNCTELFAQWLAADDYKEAYFEYPEDLDMKLEGEFMPHVGNYLVNALSEADGATVVALTGVASLYGFARISDLVRSIEPEIHGRLAVFFPGSMDQNNYRLLDARDGWNYLAAGITLHNPEGVA